MSEKLLPIVAGCQALVIKADNPGNVGRTVNVLHIILNTEDVLHSGVYWQIQREVVGRWLCEFIGAGDLPVNNLGNRCPVGAFWTSSLLRIDGGRDLLMDASDMSFNLPADWRERNKAAAK